jgi:hypothetical protein
MIIKKEIIQNLIYDLETKELFKASFINYYFYTSYCSKILSFYF